MAETHSGHAEGRAAAAPGVEIFCDESGSEGEKLVGGTTDVFAHASVRIGLDAAAACIEEVRIGARSPATEVKASVVLRDRNRGVLEWLLGPLGPLHGQAHVHLTEKTFHVVRRITTLLDEPAGGAGVPALAVYHVGPATFGVAAWTRFLAAFNDLMRSKHRAEAWLSAEAFFGQVDTLRSARRDGLVGSLLDRIADRRPDSDVDLHGLLARLRASGGLDPLIPALAAAVAYWAVGGRPVSIVHDVQGALTAARISLVREMSGGANTAGLNGHGPGVTGTTVTGTTVTGATVTGLGAAGGMPAAGNGQVSQVRSRLASIRFVDSQTDPRVQVADFLAGAARRIASDELNGHGDRELTALLRPYVDAGSIWGDRPSWSELAGA